MKKTYINPAVEVVEMKNTQPLLAGSEVLNLGDPGNANYAEAPEFPIWLLDE